MLEVLALTALLIVAVVWLAARNGRKRAEAEAAEDTLATIRKAEEIENEVEALDRDTLKSRARQWLRTPSK
jgi:hypothetical protein